MPTPTKNDLELIARTALSAATATVNASAFANLQIGAKAELVGRISAALILISNTPAVDERK